MKRSQVIAEIAFLGIKPATQTEGETEWGNGVTIRPATPMNIGLITAGWLKEALEESVAELGEDDELQPEHFDRIATALDAFQCDVLDAITIPEVLEKETQAFRAKFVKLNALRHM